MIPITIYFLAIFAHAYIRPYIELTPVERVKKGFITYSDNFDYRFLYPYRLDIPLLGFLRWLFNKPITHENLRRKVNRAIQNTSAYPEKVYKYKKYTTKYLNMNL